MVIALVGNQNSGKTTLFNHLTGSNQKVGNWPGVTVERKVGTIKGTNHQLVDLPGIYSLSPYTKEEEISRQYILEEQPDLIINIIDSTSLERSLYLTTQLLELDCKVIIALNMIDILQKKGITIDVAALSRNLGVEVVAVSALKKTGIEELIGRIDNVGNQQSQFLYSKDIEEAIGIIQSKINPNHKRFIAVKLLENDVKLKHLLDEEIDLLRESIEEKYDNDIESIIANERYDFIVRVKDDSVISNEVKETTTEKLDKVFLNKWLSLPLFAMIMFLIYFLAVGFVGGYTVDFVEGLFETIGDKLSQVLLDANASAWSVSLLVDGVLAGVGAVLAFLPQLIILFISIAVLESTGYMARVSFMLDRLFRRFGLSGKSLIPFIIGSGCSVPAVMATRTIENEQERNMTIVLTPFIPCSAKLPIIVLFSSHFFGTHSGLAAVSVYFLAIIIILFSALIMKKFIYQGEESTFVEELPEYKALSIKYVLTDAYLKTKQFVINAGTLILMLSIVIWFLVSFSWKLEYGVDIDKSILASFGNLIAWFFYPMLGEWSWAASVSAVQGMVAKEQVVSSMNIIAGVAGDNLDGGVLFNGGVFGFFTPASAYAFMVFNLFSIPCFGTVGAMKRELGSNKKLLFSLLFQTMIAWAAGVIVFWIGSLIGVIF